VLSIEDWMDGQAEPIDQRGLPHVVNALEFRPVGGTFDTPSNMFYGEVQEPTRDVWVRAKGTLPDSQLLHACVIAYASDRTLLTTAVLPHPLSDDAEGYMIASLDHVMWFHRSSRADDWMLYHVHSPSAGDGRAFARGAVFRRDGNLAVSIAQEGLFRPLRAQR
jgi:acyl-CoA thioesterase-2